MRGSFIFIKNVGFWMNLYWINMSFYYAIYRLYLVTTKKKYSKRVMNSPRTISRAKKCQSKFSSQFHNSNIKKRQTYFSQQTSQNFCNFEEISSYQPAQIWDVQTINEDNLFHLLVRFSRCFHFFLVGMKSIFCWICLNLRLYLLIIHSKFVWNMVECRV